MWCLAGWGSGGFFETELGLTQIAGSKTGGNSLRASNNVVVGWVDGHVSKKSAGSLAVGSNWTPTAPEGVDIVDTNTYVWDNL